MKKQRTDDKPAEMPCEAAPEGPYTRCWARCASGGSAQAGSAGRSRGTWPARRRAAAAGGLRPTCGRWSWKICEPAAGDAGGAGWGRGATCLGFSEAPRCSTSSRGGPHTGSGLGPPRSSALPREGAVCLVSHLPLQLPMASRRTLSMTVGVGCGSRPCATEASGPVMRLRYHWAPRLVARRSCDGKTPAPIEAEALSGAAQAASAAGSRPALRTDTMRALPPLMSWRACRRTEAHVYRAGQMHAELRGCGSACDQRSAVLILARSTHLYMHTRTHTH